MPLISPPLPLPSPPPFPLPRTAAYLSIPRQHSDPNATNLAYLSPHRPVHPIQNSLEHANNRQLFLRRRQWLYSRRAYHSTAVRISSKSKNGLRGIRTRDLNKPNPDPNPDADIPEGTSAPSAPVLLLTMPPTCRPRPPTPPADSARRCRRG